MSVIVVAASREIMSMEAVGALYVSRTSTLRDNSRMVGSAKQTLAARRLTHGEYPYHASRRAHRLAGHLADVGVHCRFSAAAAGRPLAQAYLIY